MASQYVYYNLEALEKGVERVLKRKLKNGLSDKVKKEAAGEYAVAIAKYVPYKSGRLLNSVRIMKDGDEYALRYSAHGRYKDGTIKSYDYASLQYEIPFENRTTPGTYDHWNRHLTRLEREEFIHRVTGLVMEGMNE